MMGTDQAWQKWGETDPYYAVSSVPEYRSENVQKNRAAFFESGEARIADRLHKAEKLFGERPRGRALDFGCGVGRLLIPLAKRFDNVTGIDVSSAMLRECSHNLAQFGVTNTALMPSDDTLSGVEGTFDFVHSYIVFQHIPVSRGMQLIRRLFSLTAPGGVVSLQFTTHRGDSVAQAMFYLAQRRVPGVQTLTNLARGRAVRQPLVEMNEYSLYAVTELFKACGFSHLSIEPEMQGRVESVDLMARRYSN